MRGLCLLHDRIDIVAVGKADAGSCGIDDELLREAPSDRVLVGKEQLLQLFDIVKRTAVGERAAGIDLRPEPDL